MGWDEDLFALLDDLEHQAEALYDDERAPELADRTRAEYQQVTLVSRLMASVGTDVTLDVRGVGPVAGRLERVAAGWCLVGTGSMGVHDWIVALPALTRVLGASERSVPELAWSPLTRLSLGSALRRLAESGERCVLHLLDGSRHDGVVRRVGQDFAELVDSGGRHVLVAFSGLAAVQSREI